MTDIVIIGIIVLAVGAAVWYIYKAKKSGRACIGCPNGKQCGGKCNCSDNEQADK
ncbi:MAG: FeoB-associated Cys-rich membrane protein [Clostridia bacterium]|nr:FeoB-associated Cys-rich membrane protein [Clostridia bacterium]